MYAPLSWIKKRERRWILPPLLFGAGLLLFCHLVFVPLVSGNFANYLKNQAFFQHFYLFSGHAYKYIFRWLGIGVVLLIFCQEAFILAIPYLVFGIISNQIRSYHYFPLVIILFISLIYGVGKAMQAKPLQAVAAHPARMMLPAVLVIGLVFAFDPVMFRPNYASCSMAPWGDDAWGLINRIPPQASVSCDSYLLPALSLRPVLHEFSRRSYHDETFDSFDVDYILIQPKGPLKKNIVQINYVENAQRLLNETREGRSGFEIVETRGDWVLFHRKS